MAVRELKAAADCSAASWVTRSVAVALGGRCRGELVSANWRIDPRQFALQTAGRADVGSAAEFDEGRQAAQQIDLSLVSASSANPVADA